jgi:hypothetical protein
MRSNTPYLRKTREPSLFEIPNPFDDYQREKKGWYIETRKLEEVIRTLRERVQIMTLRQQEQKEKRKELLEYSKQVRMKVEKKFSINNY